MLTFACTQSTATDTRAACNLTTYVEQRNTQEVYDAAPAGFNAVTITHKQAVLMRSMHEDIPLKLSAGIQKLPN